MPHKYIINSRHVVDVIKKIQKMRFQIVERLDIKNYEMLS